MKNKDFLEEFEILCGGFDVSSRLDLYLSNELSGYSRSALQKLIENGNVTVNENVQKPGYKLKENDIINVKVPVPKELSINPENIPLDVLYEDEGVIVVNKPKGMVVHPSFGHYEGTLVNALLYHLSGRLSGINGVLRPGIVHRIDKDTSGVLVAAKTDDAHKSLSDQLKDHSMTRKYIALVYNNIAKDSDAIDAPIGRHPKDRKKMAIVHGGRNAVTHYTVIERLGKYTLIEASLETGRTHQIRVHMSSIGHGLVGDEVYGFGNSPFNTNGQMLHAKTLGFINLTTGKYIELNAELPEYFSRILNIMRR
ncbi:MAG: RluA family pseudouridine synthase [Defluviitaleaceae bacterium]|nr:RluA family pseudouridine synthase [Defluviitaleaceae bacterium]